MFPLELLTNEFLGSSVAFGVVPEKVLPMHIQHRERDDWLKECTFAEVNKPKTFLLTDLRLDWEELCKSIVFSV